MNLVVGVGCSRGCPAVELLRLVGDALRRLDGEVVMLATVDSRADEPCVVAAAAALRVPLITHAASVLAEVPVPTPSVVVERHVGTPSVAEAAAIVSAGEGGRLVVEKRRSAHATCAVAEWRA
jgi:cobalt-precorrin 5A hydrolase